MAEEIKETNSLKKFETTQEDPWLPVESKLVWGFLGLGIVLLIIFIILFRFFFPSAPQ